MVRRLGSNQHLLLRALDALERERGPDWYSVADITEQAWKIQLAELRGGVVPDVAEVGTPDGKPLRRCPLWFEKKVHPRGVLAGFGKRGWVERFSSTDPAARLTVYGRAALERGHSL